MGKHRRSLVAPVAGGASIFLLFSLLLLVLIPLGSAQSLESAEAELATATAVGEPMWSPAPETADTKEDLLAPLTTGEAGTVTVHTDRLEIVFATMGAVPISWRVLDFPSLPPSRAKIRAYRPSAGRGERAMLDTLLARLTQDASREQALREQLAAAGNDEQRRHLERELRALRAVDLIPQDAGADRWYGALRFADVWYDSATVYEATATEVVVADEPVSLRFEARLRTATVQKTYRFYPDNYRCDLTVSVLAQPGSPLVAAQQYTLFWGPGLGQRYGRLNRPANLRFHVNQKVSMHDPVSLFRGQHKGKDVVTGTIGWFALEDQYFAAIVIPQSRIERGIQRAFAHPLQGIDDLRVLGGISVPFSAELGAVTSEERFKLYVGPKQQDRLAALGSESTDLLFHGWTGGISLLMLRVLHFFYAWTGNYGLAIICLTLLVRLVLFPIAQKQFRHMKESQAKMEKIKPLIEEIKERFKDDPQRQQQEQMKLLQQHGIMQGQLKGCLPMFLQLPIFIALFYTLQYAIELRGAPFFGWITDLAEQDAAFYIRLPVPLPLVGYVISFNILPIVNCAITWYQMKKTTTVSDPSQQIMMNIMPIFMLVLLWTWPSGLFVYWTCSSLFGFFQQYMINKTYVPEAETPAADPRNRRRQLQQRALSSATTQRNRADQPGAVGGVLAWLGKRLGLREGMKRLQQWVKEASEQNGSRGSRVSRPAPPDEAPREKRQSKRK